MTRSTVCHSLFAAVLLLAVRSGAVMAQSLDDLLDEHDFVKGISELAQPGALEKYLAAHPPTKPADDLRYRVAVARAQLEESGVDSGRRQELLDAVLRLRRQLIDQNANHPRRAIWLTDQAADLYFVQLSIDGRGLTALYGLPSDEQLRAAAQTAAEMDRLMVEAERAIERTLAAVESSAGYQKNAALQERRRQLEQSERQGRIPFFRGIAAFLDAELRANADGARRRRGYMLAANALQPLCGELEGSLAAQARVYAGLALARLGRAREADELFRAALSETAATSSDLFAARMAGSINQSLQKGPAAAISGLDEIERHYLPASDFFYRLIVVDQRFILRQRVALALPAGEPRDRAMAHAIESYLELNGTLQQSASAPSTKGMDSRAVREIILARLVIATASGAPLERLPPLAIVARARALSRDAATRSQAIALLETVVRGPAADDGTLAIALFALGESRWAAGQPLPAARAFLELAREHQVDPDAARAMELASTIAAAQYTHRTADGEARLILDESLHLLLDRYPAIHDVDRWRLLAGELAMADGRSEEAGARLQAVAPTSDQWPDAQVMLAATARPPLAKLFGGKAGPQESAAVLTVIQRARPELEKRLARIENPDEAQRLRALAARLTVFEAEARLAEGHPDVAMALLDAVRQQAELPTEVLGEALQVRLASAAAAGHTSDVLQHLHELTASAPDYAAPVAVPLLRARSDSLEALLESGSQGEPLAQAQEAVVSIARIIDAWLLSGASDAAHRAAEVASLRLSLARAYRVAGQCDAAIGHYERLLQGSPDDIALLFGRAECLSSLGGEQRLGEAMVLYKRLVAASTEARDSYFWKSQLRTLQILDRLERNTHQIAPQIRRLRQLDPQLGGPQLRAQFDALQNRHG